MGRRGGGGKEGEVRRGGEGVEGGGNEEWEERRVRRGG